MRRRLSALLLVLVVFVTGCGGGGSSSSGTGAGTTSGSTSSAMSSATSSDMSSGTSTDAAAACPTENTRNFAKTRFVADVGGALFLFKRYLYTPYQEGKFQQGANGRTRALIKAAAAAAASAKLLKNASDNAQANPTLCKTLGTPLRKAADQMTALVNSVKSGSLDAGALSGISGLLSSTQKQANKEGYNIQEQAPSGIGGLLGG